MSSQKKYLNTFLRSENGSETLEFIAVLCVSATLIAIISGAADKMKTKMQNVAGSV